MLNIPTYKILFFLMILAMLQISCLSGDNIQDMSPPELNRFTTAVLSEPGDFDEPMAFTFLNDEEMLIVERKGGVKAFNLKDQEVRSIGSIPVNTIYTDKKGQTRAAEEGLMGVIADPNFAENNWVYMHYADPDEAKHVLARWELKEDSLIADSKVVVLDYPAQREVCCHTGGGMVFDKDGNLFLTTGNNTENPRSGTSNLDERPGHENADDQRTAGNTNDLRGKILRIHPEDDGSYSIPEGNLFTENQENTRPEIYTMGHRNPWRISIDNETGFIYWGEVGPDASEDTDRGPMGYDEFNQAKGPGFFGWPYFIGDNIPYTDSLGEAFDMENPVNRSPNNTGMTNLPPPQEAFIWYPYSNSEEFPQMGSAGRSATGGPVFRLSDFPKSDQRFPAYYDGKWLISEFMRGWIMAVTMDENGDYVSMEPFLPEENFSSAIDLKFGPDGVLYVLEYGSAWFQGNENAQIKSIQYNGANRPPVVQAIVDQSAGGVPLTLQLSSEGTIDYDNDKLKYEWLISSENGYEKTIKEANPSITLEKEGAYTARLKVKDRKGNETEKVLKVIAGNNPPKVGINIENGNKSFFFPGSELDYEIVVSDSEDGSLEDGSISKDEIAINFDYVPEGFDPIEIAQNHRSSDEWVSFSKGKIMIDQSDCLSCHRVDVKSIGPSYQDVAKKYKNDAANRSLLAGRIIKGSVGVWGDHAMSAHPDLSEKDALLMVEYIMSLNNPQSAPVSIPLAGTYIPQVPEGQNGKGGYLLRVAYQDEGTDLVEAITSEKIIALRNPVLDPRMAEERSGIKILTTPSNSFNAIEDGAYIGYRKIDLTGVREIIVSAEAPSRSDSPGGIIEMHLESPTGPMIGSTKKIEAIQVDFRAEMQKLVAAWEKGGKKGPRPGFMTLREKLKPRITLEIEETNSVHDIYFVIRNPDAQKGQILLQLNEMEFKINDKQFNL